MARNFTTVIGKGKRFVPPILFQGGVAYNAAVLRAVGYDAVLVGESVVTSGDPEAAVRALAMALSLIHI